MKKIVLLVAILLSCLLSIGAGTISYANESKIPELSEDEKNSMAKYDETFLRKQSDSTESYLKLQELLSVHDCELYNVYGGAYIDENGNLIVLITQIKDEFANAIYSVDDRIIIKECEYSYQELTEIMNIINDYKNIKDIFSDEFDHYMLVDADNRIVVYLKNCNESNIQEFKKRILDSDAIMFKQSIDDGTEEATIKAGAKISSSSGSASVGYRVKLNGVTGIVTAAHFVTNGDNVSYSGNTIGTCTVSVYSGSVDAAFVEVTGETLSNTIDGGSTVLSTTISEPGSGTVINKRGFKTYSTSGTVYSTNASWTINGVNFTNLTAATYDSDNGDSGGVVYSYISSTGTRLTLGIHKGRHNGYAHYVKANAINSALGTTRY